MVLGLAFLDLGPMLASGQVQCEDWAKFNVEIGPVTMLTLNWARFNAWIGPGSMYGLGQVQSWYWA